MNITVEPATPDDVAAIDAYRYEPPYDFYNGEDDPIQNPERVYAVRDDGELVGFYYFEQREDAVEYGLGLRPDLTGRGLGSEFFRRGLELARERFGATKLVLNVAAFNQRAIRVYERAGFRRTGEHVRTFERWGAVPFVEMELTRTNLFIERASPEDLADRATWRYEPPYDFYDDDGRPVKNPERFCSVRDDAGRLVGFFYFERRGAGVFYGLGMRPDLTGQGLGLEFVRTGIAVARERFGPRRLVLDVAEFNARAIKVYERAGFRVTGRHTRYFEGRGDVPFIDMQLDA